MNLAGRAIFVGPALAAPEADARLVPAQESLGDAASPRPARV
jgi:hypothetical protein